VENSPSSRTGLARLRGLRRALEEAVLGQEEALAGLCDALLAGELGHTPAGRPRSIVLILGPTGTGKTRAVAAASSHLYGTDAIARINAAEFASGQRVPLLLGSGPGQPGLLGAEIARLRRAGGRILLIDEIEKADPRVSDLLLGIEEASVTLASGERLDLSDLHIVATSNIGSQAIVELEGVARSSLRRYVEQEAAAHFRPEVVARFSAILVFAQLSRDTQVRICRKMLEEEVAFQSGVLSRRFGHPHLVRAEPGVWTRLVSEGWSRRLGARPMRNAVERRVRGALVEAQLRGALGPGVSETVLTCDARSGVRAAVGRADYVL
jgi:ATP-dependent Clp protease ATP-binding subunit ClpB